MKCREMKTEIQQNQNVSKKKKKNEMSVTFVVSDNQKDNDDGRAHIG